MASCVKLMKNASETSSENAEVLHGEKLMSIAGKLTK